MAGDDIKRIPINELRQEEGARELTTSPSTEPCLDFIKAVIQNDDPFAGTGRDPPVAAGQTMCLASGVGLEMGFTDFDDLGFEKDKRTLAPWDFGKAIY